MSNVSEQARQAVIEEMLHDDDVRQYTLRKLVGLQVEKPDNHKNSGKSNIDNST
jgi:hypothetical protein